MVPPPAFAPELIAKGFNEGEIFAEVVSSISCSAVCPPFLEAVVIGPYTSLLKALHVTYLDCLIQQNFDFIFIQLR